MQDLTESSVPSERIGRRGARYRCYLFVKRAFDLLSSGLALLLLGWFILLLLLVKWLEDFHNPIYVSRRVGKGGKEFRFYKIRSMCPHAEQPAPQSFSHAHPEPPHFHFDPLTPGRRSRRYAAAGTPPPAGFSGSFPSPSPAENRGNSTSE